MDRASPGESFPGLSGPDPPVEDVGEDELAERSPLTGGIAGDALPYDLFGAGELAASALPPRTQRGRRSDDDRFGPDSTMITSRVAAH